MMRVWEVKVKLGYVNYWDGNERLQYFTRTVKVAAQHQDPVGARQKAIAHLQHRARLSLKDADYIPPWRDLVIIEAK